MDSVKKNWHRCIVLKREFGQALVEFALVLMFIILPFTFVLVDGALMLFHQVNIANTVREGARAGSIWQCDASKGCVVDFTSSVWSQYPIMDAARLQFIKDDMRQHYNPIANFDDCQTDIVYTPDPPRIVLPDGTIIWNVTRGLYSLSVHLSCPHRLLFGIVATDVVTLTGESKMNIEPGGTTP